MFAVSLCSAVTVVGIAGAQFRKAGVIPDLSFQPERETVRVDTAAPRSDSAAAIEAHVRLDTIHIRVHPSDSLSFYEAMLSDLVCDLSIPARVALIDTLATLFAADIDLIGDTRPDLSISLAAESEQSTAGAHIRLLYARITSGGHSLEAVAFDSGYYDMNGARIGEGPPYPIRLAQITSGFSWRRYHPVLGVYRAHLGMDFGAVAGTPVAATAAGTVSFVGKRGGYGNLVILSHGNEYSTYYAHLSAFEPTVVSGAAINRGATIGYVGSTGLATAPHLHYEVRRAGLAVAPAELANSSGDALRATKLQEFRIHQSALRKMASAQTTRPRSQPR